MVFSVAVHTTLFALVYNTDFMRGLTYGYRHRAHKSRATLAIFILIIFNFIGTTIYWAACIAYVTIQIRWSLVKNVGVGLSKTILINAATAKPFLMELFFQPFLVS